MSTRLRISKGGQISVPAPVRQRWGTATVVAEDHGDHLVLRPAPDDPVEAAFGALADAAAGPPTEEVRRADRDQDAEDEERRWSTSTRTR